MSLYRVSVATDDSQEVETCLADCNTELDTILFVVAFYCINAIY